MIRPKAHREVDVSLGGDSVTHRPIRLVDDGEGDPRCDGRGIERGTLVAANADVRGQAGAAVFVPVEALVALAPELSLPDEALLDRRRPESFGGGISGSDRPSVHAPCRSEVDVDADEI